MKMLKDSSFRRIADLLIKPGDIYHLLGWFKQADETYMFGGYFKHYRNNNKIIEGEIVDMFGNSKIINGYMDSRKLEFGKEYINHINHINSTFNYKFKKEKGIWVGSYDGQSNDNRVMAVTKLAYKNLYKNKFEVNLINLEKLLEITKF